MSVELSIVVPTANRAALLEGCLRVVRQTVGSAYEVIVIDGASYDETPAILAEAADAFGPRLRVITERNRGGFVRACNLGLRAAVGRCVTWLADDARPRPGALDAAARQAADVGLVALYQPSSSRHVAYATTIDGRRYAVGHVRGTAVAEVAVGRRAVFAQLDFLDERYHDGAADADLSLKAWAAGLAVVPSRDGAAVDHADHDGSPTGGWDDTAKLFAKWHLPPADPLGNSFDPAHPCTSRGLRSAHRRAA